MRKSEATSKANIQNVKNKIQALDFKIKGMDIDHFHGKWSKNNFVNQITQEFQKIISHPNDQNLP